MKALYRVLPVIIWSALIILLSTGAGSESYTEKWLSTLLNPAEMRDIDQINYLIRKSAHVIQFIIFVVLAWGGISVITKNSIVKFGAVIISALLLAGASEATQMLFASRTASILDIAIDATGIFIGFGIISLITLAKITRG